MNKMRNKPNKNMLFIWQFVYKLLYLHNNTNVLARYLKINVH